MIDCAALWQCLSGIGLDSSQGRIEALIRERLQDSAHGDFVQWRQTLEALRAGVPDEPESIRESLQSLAPWRKGPFEVAGLTIDSEWRSDLKWARLNEAIESLEGRAVLDVGCGNGFYALQMKDAGAKLVVGIDPTLLYVMQFLAVQEFQREPAVFVLPLRLDELPANTRAFDTTFSMGVLYHQRSPIDHLRQLKATLRAGGQLVLETIFLPGEDAHARTPAGRYARMRNVWLLPTISELETWLARSGFREVRVIDTAITTTDEQRSTEWMPFESLREALDPDDPGKTVEGWPAPRRVVILANSP